MYRLYTEVKVSTGFIKPRAEPVNTARFDNTFRNLQSDWSIQSNHGRNILICY